MTTFAQIIGKSKVTTEDGNTARLQITYMMDISGDYQSESPFALKNITEENVSVTGRLAGMPEGSSITTPLAPGWNPELWVEIENAPASTLQIGY